MKADGGRRMIDARSLSTRLGLKTAVDDVRLTVAPGIVTGLRGLNSDHTYAVTGHAAHGWGPGTPPRRTA
jgi:hypothetical protein